MSSARPHPFTLVFGNYQTEYFPRIQEQVGSDVVLEQFILTAPALELMRALHPDDGSTPVGEDFLAFIHAAYRYWAAGAQDHCLSDEATRALCAPSAPAGDTPRGARYIQAGPRIIWGSLDGGEHFEPLDGWFTVPTEQGLRAVALFGVHPERPGVSVIQAEGRVTLADVEREDGSPLFTPTMSGGELAGLHAVASLGELLLLAWRAEGLKEGE